MPRKSQIDARYDAARHVLVLTASNEGRATLREAYARGGYRYAESEIAEAFHEAYEFIDAGHIPGAMTDAPILADCDGVVTCDNGAVVVLESARVFAFMDYMLVDPFEQLKNTGRVEFPAAFNPEPQSLPLPRDLESYIDGERQGCAVFLGELANEDTVPEIADEYGQAFPGWYFWSDGRRFGPFGTGAVGWSELLDAGGKPLPGPDKDQLVMPWIDKLMLDWTPDYAAMIAQEQQSY